MSEEPKQEAFLDRWSRLKREQPKPEEKPAPVVAKEDRPAPLPPVEQLKPESDFTPFMDPKVDPGVRRDALKKLFADAHFKAIDPFEPYSVDLTGEDPIPEAMLKNLNHARRLLFDEPEKTAEAAVEAQAAAEATAQASEETQATPQTQETEPKNVAGKQDA
jgi:hypothetical protein